MVNPKQYSISLVGSGSCESDDKYSRANKQRSGEKRKREFYYFIK